MKRFLASLITLAIGLTAAIGAAIPGTVVLNPITLGDDTITNKSIGSTVEMKGTPKQVSNAATLFDIPAARRTEGMEAWVVDVAKGYRLVGGILNANWVEINTNITAVAVSGGPGAGFIILRDEAGNTNAVVTNGVFYGQAFIGDGSGLINVPSSGFNNILTNVTLYGRLTNDSVIASGTITRTNYTTGVRSIESAAGHLFYLSNSVSPTININGVTGDIGIAGTFTGDGSGLTNLANLPSQEHIIDITAPPWNAVANGPDTLPAFQAAYNHLVLTQMMSGDIYCPMSLDTPWLTKYIWSSPLVRHTNAYNTNYSQLWVPEHLGLFSNNITVRLIGPTMPAKAVAVLANNETNYGGVAIVCTLANDAPGMDGEGGDATGFTYGNGASMISTMSTAVTQTWMNVINLGFQNLTFICPSNPHLSAINAYNAAGLIAEDVMIHCGHSGFNTNAKPSSYTSTGIVTPRNSNGAFTWLERCTVVGFSVGFQLNEHVYGNYLDSYGCGVAYVMGVSQHGMSFGQLKAHNCQYGLVAANGPATFTIDLFDTEHAPVENGWQASLGDIYDPNNYLTCRSFPYALTLGGYISGIPTFIQVGTNINAFDNRTNPPPMIGSVSLTNVTVGASNRYVGTFIGIGGVATTNGLSAYWRMDEVSDGSVGVNRLDSFGSTDLSDIISAASAVGIITNAVNFEADDGDFLLPVEGPAISTSLGGSFSWNLWVKFESLASGVTAILQKDDFNTAREYGVYYDSTNARIRFYTGRSGSQTADFVDANVLGAPATNTWYMLTCVHDADSHLNAIYVNAGVGDFAGYTTGPTDTASDLIFGRFGPTSEEFFDGLLDEVGFWKRALNAAERMALYNVGAGAAYPSGFNFVAAGPAFIGNGESVTNLNAGNISAGTLALARGGTASSLSDPGAHRLWGWDDTDNAVKWFTLGTGLSYDAGADTLSATGGGSSFPLTANTMIATNFTGGLERTMHVLTDEGNGFSATEYRVDATRSQHYMANDVLHYTSFGAGNFIFDQGATVSGGIIGDGSGLTNLNANNIASGNLLITNAANASWTAVYPGSVNTSNGSLPGVNQATLTNSQLTLGYSGILVGQTNLLEQRNGTSAQMFHVYNTFTDASNYERGYVGWAGNVFSVGPQNAGTGASRDMKVFANAGSIIFRNNAADRWQVNPSGHFLAGIDNTYDIGASGATRPRNGYFGGLLSAGAASTINWFGRSVMASPSDGVVTFYNSGVNGFNRIQFGGTGVGAIALTFTNAIGGGMEIKTADNAAYTNVTAQGFISTGNNTLRTNTAVFDSDNTDIVVGTAYTNTARRLWIAGSFQLNAAAAGTAKVTVYSISGTTTNKLSISAGPLASLTTTEPLMMRVQPSGYYYYADETSGTGATVSFVAGTHSRFYE